MQLWTAPIIELHLAMRSCRWRTASDRNFRATLMATLALDAGFLAGITIRSDLQTRITSTWKHEDIKEPPKPQSSNLAAGHQPNPGEPLDGILRTPISVAHKTRDPYTRPADSSKGCTEKHRRAGAGPGAFRQPLLTCPPKGIG